MDWPTLSLTGFLDWLDEAAGGLIRLAYLAAGMTAVAVYFGAGQLPPVVDAAFNAALPWALAFALETHTYLTARRVRATWQDRDTGALRVNVAVLAVLLAFSAWNQLGYLSGAWSPPHNGPLALPTWLAYAVRALIVPCAFMAAAFLAPLAPPIAAQIEGEARATLADVFKIARKQRQTLLKEAEASGRDMTGALVELVSDPETRRIISHAYSAIRAPVAAPAAAAAPLGASQGAGMALSAQVKADELTQIEAGHGLLQPTPEGAGGLVVALPESSSMVAEAVVETPDRPPTGPGSPLVASKPARPMVAVAPNVTPLRREPGRGLGRRPRPDHKSAARANARIRAALATEPSITPERLATRAGVSSSSVSKWLAVIEAERAAQQQQAAQ